MLHIFYKTPINLSRGGDVVILIAVYSGGELAS
jgi:hypothetical protein